MIRQEVHPELGDGRVRRGAARERKHEDRDRRGELCAERGHGIWVGSAARRLDWIFVRVGLPSRRGLRIPRFVDDQAPEAAGGACCAEVLEIECEDRQDVSLGHGHDDGIGEPKVEVRKPGIDLGGAAQEPGRQVSDCVLTGIEGGEE